LRKRPLYLNKDFISVSRIGIIPALLAIFISCADLSSPESSGLVESPDEIAKYALLSAIEYTKADTVYEYGGQDLLSVIRIDCSGLVVNCYKYATDGRGYAVPFNDTTVINFYNIWTVPTDIPRPGDLIFMGETDTPTHISIFVKEDAGVIYFIDSTRKTEEGIDGVSERSYSADVSRFLSFGRLLLKKL